MLNAPYLGGYLPPVARAHAVATHTGIIYLMTTTPGKSNQTYLKFSVLGDTSQGSKVKGQKQTKRKWTRQIVAPLWVPIA
jgi:hypothetical protein